MKLASKESLRVLELSPTLPSNAGHISRSKAFRSMPPLFSWRTYTSLFIKYKKPFNQNYFKADSTIRSSLVRKHSTSDSREGWGTIITECYKRSIRNPTICALLKSNDVDQSWTQEHLQSTRARVEILKIHSLCVWEV